MEEEVVGGVVRVVVVFEVGGFGGGRTHGVVFSAVEVEISWLI